MVWLCNRPTPAGHLRAVAPNGPPYSRKDQSLSNINHSIDSVSSHYQWNRCCYQTARQGLPEAPRYSIRPITEVTDLEAAIRQIRQLSCILDSCTISAATKLVKRRKLYCFCHIQPKGRARYRKSLMHRYHHALMMSIIFHTMKTTCKSTSVLEPTATAMMEPWEMFL